MQHILPENRNALLRILFSFICTQKINKENNIRFFNVSLNLISIQMPRKSFLLVQFFMEFDLKIENIMLYMLLCDKYLSVVQEKCFEHTKQWNNCGLKKKIII